MPQSLANTAARLRRSDLRHSIAFQGDALSSDYEHIVLSVLMLDRSVASTTSAQRVEEEIAKAIKDNLASGTSFSGSDVSNIMRNLNSTSLEDWQVFRRLDGATVSRGSINLGHLRVFRRDRYLAHVKRRYRHVLLSDADRLFPETALDPLQLQAVISTTVAARDSTYAREVADLRFKWFDRGIRFVVGRSRLYTVGVFDNEGYRWSQFIALSPTGQDGREHYSGSIPFDLSSYDLKSTALGLDELWGILSQAETVANEPRENIHARILRAVDWVGRGVNDRDHVNAFIQFIFALEALFTVGSGSIGTRLAESASYLLGSTFNDRVARYEEVTTLYAKRSEVAHGDVSAVSEADTELAFKYVRSCVARMLTHRRISKMQGYSEFQDWVKKNKFS